nr:hypothetical protein [Angustibacter aerolatus]
MRRSAPGASTVVVAPGSVTSSSGTGWGLRWPNSSMSKAHSFGSITMLAWVNPVAQPVVGTSRPSR